MDIKTIRRNNLERLIEEAGGQKQLAEIIGKSPAQISQLINQVRHIGHKVARDIEAALKLPANWMDADHPTVAREDSAPYDLMLEAETAEAMDKFRLLDHAFRQYILIKMDELLTYTDRLPPFMRSRLQAPTSDNYQQWEREMEADRARLNIRDQNNSEHET